MSLNLQDDLGILNNVKSTNKLGLEDDLGILGDKQPEPTIGFFGKVPVSEYQAGKRNIVGNIFERPAAATREAIRTLPFGGESPKQAFKRASINPSSSETFQDEALRKYYGEKNPSLLKIVGGFGVSGVGLVADIVTNPAQLLMGLAPKIPVGSGKNIGQVIMATKPMQSLKAIGKTPIKDLGISKALVSERGGSLPLVTNNPNLNKYIDNSISKAIRPSVVGKGTSTQTINYYDNAKLAVQSIFKNKDNLVFDDPTHPMGYVNKLPQSLREFSSAIEQTKNNVFSAYDLLQKQAGQTGIKIPLASIADEIEKGVNNKAIQTLYPEVGKYALAKAQALREAGSFTPQETQDAIKMLNNHLQAFYKNPTPDTASKTIIDSAIVNNLRSNLDSAIMNMPEKLPSDSTLGLSYQALKKQYGALKTIEKDVNRRAIVEGRKNIKGLIDFSDIISGGSISRGILTLNPVEFTTGLIQKGIANYIKFVNSPDRIIKQMFKTVERVNARKVISR
jgi:hypothetical protein